jgi:hypothetical protein
MPLGASRADRCAVAGGGAVVGVPFGGRGESGVPFRTIVYEDGTVERWQQPELQAWEIPKKNPHERRPRAPDCWEPAAAAEIAKLAAARDDAAGGDIAA